MTPAKKHTKLFYAHIAVIVFGLAAFAAGAFHGEIWFDEAYTVGAVRNNFSDMYAHITRDVHPPLYYILLWLWAQVFGSGFASLRIFSVLFAAALPLPAHRGHWLMVYQLLLPFFSHTSSGVSVSPHSGQDIW